MSHYLAIPAGKKIPEQYRHMGAAGCDVCGAQYLIVHSEPIADESLVVSHAREIKHVLVGEHVDEKFSAHLESYDLG